MCRLLKASQMIPPTLLTPARPRGKNNTGTPNTVEDRGNGGLAPSSEIKDFWWAARERSSRERQQSTSPIPWDYPRPKGLVVRWLDCEPETPTARDSSALSGQRHFWTFSVAVSGRWPPFWRSTGYRTCKRCADHSTRRRMSKPWEDVSSVIVSAQTMLYFFYIYTNDKKIYLITNNSKW